MAAGHQRCRRSEYCACVESHPDMLSRWRIRSGLGARPTPLLPLASPQLTAVEEPPSEPDRRARRRKRGGWSVAGRAADPE